MLVTIRMLNVRVKIWKSIKWKVVVLAISVHVEFARVIAPKIEKLLVLDKIVQAIARGKMRVDVQIRRSDVVFIIAVFVIFIIIAIVIVVVIITDIFRRIAIIQDKSWIVIVDYVIVRLVVVQQRRLVCFICYEVFGHPFQVGKFGRRGSGRRSTQ